jgi:hypothetical protein
MESKIVTARRALIVVVLLLSTVFPISQTSTLYGQQLNRDLEELIQDIVSDVVTRTAEKAEDIINRHTGIDVRQQGYGRGRRHESLPRDASDESRRELAQLRQEHIRKINKLEDELDQKLDKAESEFKREASKENRRDKIIEKRRKLENKVDEAYAKFNEKIDEENRRFDEKRDKIIDKSRMKQRDKN